MTLDRIKGVSCVEVLPELGSGKKIRCPLHKEKEASFSYDAEKNLWHCFGCGKGGSVIDLVMELENLDYIEARKRVADIGGIKLGEISKQDLERDELEQRRNRILMRMTKGFEEILASGTGPPIEKARVYLSTRHMEGGVGLGSNRIGLANIEKLRASKQFSDEDLVLVGFLKEETLTPLFKGWRIWFPVLHRNKVVSGTFREFE
jgi:DNA primase